MIHFIQKKLIFEIQISIQYAITKIQSGFLFDSVIGTK